jgi:hypothetical protein
VAVCAVTHCHVLVEIGLQSTSASDTGDRLSYLAAPTVHHSTCAVSELNLVRRLVLASDGAWIPTSWSDAIVVRKSQLAASTPPGCVARAVQWVQTIPDIEVNNRSLLDLLRYDGTSLWWFIDTLVFSSAKEAILTIERSERVLHEKAPRQVLVAGLGNLTQLITHVCKGKEIECTASDSPRLMENEPLTDAIKITAGRILRMTKEFRRRRATKCATRTVSGGPRVLFLSPSANWRSIWSYEQDRYEKRDAFMGRIMQALQRQGLDITGVDVDYTLNGHVALLREKTSNNEIRWVPFEQYLGKTVGARLSSNPQYTEISHTFNMLEQSEKFQRSLYYRSIPLWGFVRSRFRRALSSLHALYYPRLIEGAREMIRVEQPDVIAMSYETGAYARAAVVAAWERGIPTVGIQHGFITPDSAEYMHPKTARSNSEQGCPIPTKTALGGQYSIDMLTKLSSYPKESVTVTGYTKHDDLAELKRNESKLDKGALLSDLGLSPDKTTIMIASGGFHAKYGWSNPEYDRAILETMLGFSAPRPNIQLLLRLHPMEDGTMQREVIGKRRAKAAIVKGERNDLLWASDMLVTVNSVISLDALILEKPVLMLDGTSADIPMVDLGGAPLLYKLDNLRELAAKLIDTLQLSEQRREEIQSQIVRHANSVEGYASVRVATLLRELVESRTEDAKSEAHRV